MSLRKGQIVKMHHDFSHIHTWHLPKNVWQKQPAYRTIFPLANTLRNSKLWSHTGVQFLCASGERYFLQAHELYFIEKIPACGQRIIQYELTIYIYIVIFVVFNTLVSPNIHSIWWFQSVLLLSPLCLLANSGHKLVSVPRTLVLNLCAHSIW